MSEFSMEISVSHENAAGLFPSLWKACHLGDRSVSFDIFWNPSYKRNLTILGDEDTQDKVKRYLPTRHTN